MLVHKYRCYPADDHSRAAALDEIARYVQARNRLLQLSRKWQRVTEQNVLPEFRQRAAELRAEPRTGRKPSLRTRLVAGDPISARAQPSIERIVSAPRVDKVMAALRERYRRVEVLDTGLPRPDCAELSAADHRALYAEFISAGGSYATWWLAEAAAKKAEHTERDEYAGRAGIMAQWLRWDGGGGAIVHYAGTSWVLRPKQLARRPVPEQARIAQAWLQRERTSTGLRSYPRYVWSLVLVLDDVSAPMHPVGDQRTAAGLDIGWRQDADEREDTLRVAYVADESGAHRPIRMTAQQYARLRHAASIAALADCDANHMRAELKLPANTSHRRLIELAPRPADAPPYDPTRPPLTLHEYAEHMIHLEQWQHGQRRNAIASRDEHYRLEVHALCRAHHTIYIEKIKGTPSLVQRAGTRRKKGAPEDAKGGVAREQRQMAAPFTFLRTLQREAPKFSATVIEVPAEFTSRVCEDCDYDMGPPTSRERSCAGCGRRWDIDHLAGRNLLRWGPARKPAENAAE